MNRYHGVGRRENRDRGFEGPCFHTQGSNVHTYSYIVKFYNIKNIHNFFEQGNGKIL